MSKLKPGRKNGFDELTRGQRHRAHELRATECAFTQTGADRSRWVVFVRAATRRPMSAPMPEALQELFATGEDDGVISFDYDTRAFVGSIVA